MRYVDDIVRTVNENLEEANKKDKLAFRDINVNVDSGKDVICDWYQKPTGTALFFLILGYAHLSIIKNIVEIADHRFF